MGLTLTLLKAALGEEEALDLRAEARSRDWGKFLTTGDTGYAETYDPAADENPEPEVPEAYAKLSTGQKAGLFFGIRPK